MPAWVCLKADIYAKIKNIFCLCPRGHYLVYIFLLHPVCGPAQQSGVNLVRSGRKQR